MFSYPKFYAEDGNGDPLRGGKLYSYTAGTTTAKVTYSDNALTTANANPTILNSRGEATVYLSGTYKFVLKDSDDNVLWTLDDVGVTEDEVIKTLANDATPSVTGGNRFKTGGTTTITDFDDGYAGQLITVISKHSVTFDITTAQDASHNLDGGVVNLVTLTGDVTQWLCEDGTTWHLVSFMPWTTVV